MRTQKRGFAIKSSFLHDDGFSFLSFPRPQRAFLRSSLLCNGEGKANKENLHVKIVDQRSNPLSFFLYPRVSREGSKKKVVSLRRKDVTVRSMLCCTVLIAFAFFLRPTNSYVGLLLSLLTPSDFLYSLYNNGHFGIHGISLFRLLPA